MKDPQERLRSLYDKMCEAMEAKLENPETITAADLQAIRAVLKDNGITSLLSDTGPLRGVVDAAVQLEADAQQFPFAVPNSVLPPDDPVVRGAKAVAH